MADKTGGLSEDEAIEQIERLLWAYFGAVQMRKTPDANKAIDEIKALVRRLSAPASSAAPRDDELCPLCRGNGVMPLLRESDGLRIGVEVCRHCHGLCWATPSRSEQQSQGGISDFSEAITEMQNDLVCMAFNALHVGRHGEVDQDTLDVLDAFVIPIERITEWRIADELADACAAVDCAKAKDHAAIIKGLQSQELRHLFTKDSAATPSAPTTKLGEASSKLGVEASSPAALGSCGKGEQG